MKDEIVIKPDSNTRSVSIFVYCMLVVWVGAIIYERMWILIWFPLLCALFFALVDKMNYYTIIMNKDGCTIQFRKKKEIFRWDEFSVIRYRKYKVYNRYTDAYIFFSVKSLNAKYPIISCMFHRRCFYIDLVNNYESYVDRVGCPLKNVFAYDDFVYKLEQWGVKVSNLPNIKINPLLLHKNIAYPIDENKYTWVIKGTTQEHILKCVPRSEKGMYKLYLDDDEIIIDKKSMNKYSGIDQEFCVENVKYRFVMCCGHIDLVMNKRYVFSRNKYYPPKRLYICAFIMLIFIIGVVIAVFFESTVGVVMSYPLLIYLLLFFMLFVDGK